MPVPNRPSVHPDEVRSMSAPDVTASLADCPSEFHHLDVDGGLEYGVSSVDVRQVVVLVIQQVEPNDYSIEHGYDWHNGILLGGLAISSPFQISG